jgi:hypothetical protein
MNEVGMKTTVGKFGSNGKTLTVMNDNGKSFEEIADLIENNWKKL